MADMANPNFENLPTELLQKIYSVCPSIEDAISLSSTCKIANKAFNSSHKLHIVESIVERNFGPISDAISLVTYIESDSAYTQSPPAISLALLKQVDRVGRVADKWADLYPMEKWKWNFESRRLLTLHERYKLRRAVYRIWLYCDIFHTVKRLTRPHSWDFKPLQFLQKFSSREAEELLDMDSIFGSVLEELCPNNGMISQRAKEQYPDHQLFFGSLGNPGLRPSAIEYESWGDIFVTAGVVSELKKLNPYQLIQFMELKGAQQRKAFVMQMDYLYEGRFRGTWSQLFELLLSYLKTDHEAIITDGGIVAADD